MKRIMILAGVAALLVSCNKFLDRLPDNRAELTEDNLAQMLISAYPTGLPILMMELASDNVSDNGPSYGYNGWEQIRAAFLYEDFKGDVGWDDPTDAWEKCYSAIASANQVLLEIERMGDPGDLSAVKAEALLCRAFSHFMLAQAFCIAYNHESSETDLGIPYAVKAETTVRPKYERGTVKQLYDNINDDIEAALPYITDNYAVPKYHFNTSAAYAFAAKFNLHYGQWQKVVDYATKAIGENPRELLRNLKAMNEAAAANIDRHYIYIDIEQPCNFMLLPLYSIWARQYPWWPIRYSTNGDNANNTFNQRFPFGDLNRGMLSWYWGSGVSYFGAMLGEIFEENPLTPDSGMPHLTVIPFTADETLICRAEAHAMLENYDAAAADLSHWYWRNGPAALGEGAVCSAQKISDFYAEKNGEVNPNDPPPAMREDMESRWLADNSDPVKDNLVRACLAVRRNIGTHLGMRWPDMKRHGIRLTRKVMLTDTQVDAAASFVVEPYSNLTALQLPNAVIAAGMTPNPR